MDYLQRQYILQLSNRLRNFTPIKKGFNFSCPFCGDSKTDKFKKRGYILTKKGTCYYYCHNDQGCNCSFENFLERMDSSLKQQYILDKFKKPEKEKRTIIETKSNWEKLDLGTSKDIDLPSIKDLPEDHPAKKYIIKRKIPQDSWGDLFFAEKFMAYVNKLKNENIYSDAALKNDHPRLIIPFRDTNNNVFMIQGRAFHKCTSKYLSIKLNDEAIKIYGLNKVSSDEPVYILEGPVDSMFIYNSVAMAGADIDLKECPFKNNRVFVLDNEPRSKEITKKYDKLIKAGESVVSWLNCPYKGKDINEMILNGANRVGINNYLRVNTVSGLDAQLRISSWRNV